MDGPKQHKVSFRLALRLIRIYLSCVDVHVPGATPASTNEVIPLLIPP